MAAFENLSLLRAFVGIVESGSISAGARRLKLPQPTLSRYLRQLEQQAGAPLIRRDTHRMSLTEAGHRLLADARTMLALAEDAEQRLHEDQAALGGHLRLFATIDFGQSMVTRLIANFLQTNPGVTAELGDSNRKEQASRAVQPLGKKLHSYLGRFSFGNHTPFPVSQRLLLFAKLLSACRSFYSQPPLRLSPLVSM